MNRLRIRLAIAVAVLHGTAAPVFSAELGDILGQIIRDSSSHYQAPPHYSNPGGYSPYTPPPLDADPTVRNQHAYDVGFRVGQDDFHHHQEKHFTRHPDLFDNATHDSFASGYEAGYDVAREGASGGKNPYTPPRTSPESVKSPLYPSGYYPYSPPPRAADKETRNRHGYDVGYRVGQDDFHHGHSKHYTRHDKMYDNETKHNFALGYEHGYDKARSLDRDASNPAKPSRALVASVGQGGLTIKDGGRTVSKIRTASQNVENYHFTSEQKQIVVKSRGNHGPATVELFDVQTGTLRDKILAFAIKQGRPAWAQGMED